MSKLIPLFDSTLSSFLRVSFLYVNLPLQVGVFVHRFKVLCKLLLVQFFSLFPSSFEALSILSCGSEFNEGLLVLLVDGFEIVFIVVFFLVCSIVFNGSNLELKVFENQGFYTRFVRGLEAPIFYLRLRVLCLV